jgi:hypothetical protein
MRALVVYESMYGNTHDIANHIAEGLLAAYAVEVLSVEEATPARVAGADLLVVGGPTHAHAMSSKMSRQAAADAAAKDPDLELDGHATGPGLRDWFDTIEGGGAAAAFDTRIDSSPLVTGRASRGIGRRLRRRGYKLAAEPESFLVDKHNHLLDGEADRAVEWGKALAEATH